MNLSISRLAITEQTVEKLIEEDMLFNEPWMDHINNDLLYRYWLKKRTSKILILKKQGVKIAYKKYGILGVLGYLVQPYFSE